MKELIRITEHDGKKAVSARELYEFLGVKERFSKWFDKQIGFGFIEGTDYTPYQMVHPSNYQEIDDYVLTVGCAKEISMIQRSEKGRQARRYFIACEETLSKIANNQLAQAKESAKRRLLLSGRVKEIDVTITNLMKERRVLVKKLRDIDSFDFQQLNFSFDVDVTFSVSFPNKSLKIS
jgi:Phage anti-repressor protein